MPIVHVMTVHDDCNGHFTRDIFHCGAMISSLAKVVGLQSEKCYFGLRGMKNIVSSVDKTFNMTAVIILVIFTYYFYYWKSIAHVVGN